MSSEEETATDTTCQFLQLPECVLRVLFSYLDATTLYQLTRTCCYFQYFIKDPVFWRYIDARRNPNTNDKVNYCSNRIHEKTTHVLLRAKDNSSGLVPHNFFKLINPFKNIKVLALESQRFNGSHFKLKDFPSCLEELSLKGSHVKSSTYFFQHSGQSMQKLRVLILDQCQWVTCSFLMSVAKFESLEIISAVNCLRLHLNMVPYLNFARYGCKKLKIFDCRFTSIGHESLRTFYPKQLLQGLYCQSLKSAEMDYKGYFCNPSYVSKEYSNGSREGDNSICDESLFDYINLYSCCVISPVTKSALYKDPYPDCTCGSKEKPDWSPPPLQNLEEYYVCKPPRRKSVKFVCQRHIQDTERLSDNFKEVFFRNQPQFFADVHDTKIKIETESSDSDSDEESHTCCMYGMGSSFILLSPGSNNGSVLEPREEVFELLRDENPQRAGVRILISRVVRDVLNQGNDENPTPGTSRGTEAGRVNIDLQEAHDKLLRRFITARPEIRSHRNPGTSRNSEEESVCENRESLQTTIKRRLIEFGERDEAQQSQDKQPSVDEAPTSEQEIRSDPVPGSSRGSGEERGEGNIGDLRTAPKRRLSGDKERDEQNKRLRGNDVTQEMSDEARSAEAERLIQSADEMKKNMNEFMRDSLEICKKDRNGNTTSLPSSQIERDGTRINFRGTRRISSDDQPIIRITFNRSNRTENDNPTNDPTGPRGNFAAHQPGSSGGVDKKVSPSYFSRNTDGTFGNRSENDNPTNDPTGSRSNFGAHQPGTSRGVNYGASTSNIRRITHYNFSRRRPDYFERIVFDSADEYPSGRCSNENCPNAQDEPSRQLLGNAPRATITVRKIGARVQNANRQKKRSGLRRLSLRGFRGITNKALDYIRNLKLDLLDLTYTNVTKEGIENFLAYNPACRVIHPLYCTCKPLNPF